MAVEEQLAVGAGATVLAGGRDVRGGAPCAGEGGHLPLVSQEQRFGATCETLLFIVTRVLLIETVMMCM